MNIVDTSDVTPDGRIAGGYCGMECAYVEIEACSVVNDRCIQLTGDYGPHWVAMRVSFEMVFKIAEEARLAILLRKFKTTVDLEPDIPKESAQ